MLEQSVLAATIVSDGEVGVSSAVGSDFEAPSISGCKSRCKDLSYI